MLFTCLVALTTLAGCWLGSRPSWPRALLLGSLLGLGAGTKLSPLFVAIGLAAYGAGLLAVGALLRWRGLERARRWLPGIGSPAISRLAWMLIAAPVVALGLFIVTYPYLWPDPVGRTQAIFDFRRDEMASQARIWPVAAIDSRGEALSRIWRNLEIDYSSSGIVKEWIGQQLGRETRPRGIDLPVAVAGWLLMIAIALRRGVASPVALVSLLVAAQSVAIVGGLRVDFNRYYLPLVYAMGVGIGVAFGLAWSGALSLTRRLMSSWSLRS
jgi:hypothetical protein